MPKPKKFRPRKKERRWGDKRNDRDIVFKSPTVGIPDRALVKLRYTDLDTPTITRVGAITPSCNYVVYKLNSAYDVNNVGASFTLAGFNEWTNFYQRYRVQAVAYDITLCNESLYSTNVYVVPMQSGSTLTNDWYEISSQTGNKFVKSAMLGSEAGTSRTRLRGYIDIGKLFGNQLQYDADASYQATVTADPASLFYMYTCAAIADKSTNDIAITHKTILTYYIEFFDKKQLEQV